MDGQNEQKLCWTSTEGENTLLKLYDDRSLRLFLWCMILVLFESFVKKTTSNLNAGPLLHHIHSCTILIYLCMYMYVLYVHITYVHTGYICSIHVVYTRYTYCMYSCTVPVHWVPYRTWGMSGVWKNWKEIWFMVYLPGTGIYTTKTNTCTLRKVSRPAQRTRTIILHEPAQPTSSQHHHSAI